MTQDAIQDLQKAANANKRMEGLLLGAYCASVGTAFALQWMRRRGHSIAKPLAIGILSEGFQGLVLYRCRCYRESVIKIEIKQPLDAADPKVEPYLPYFPKAYPWIDPDKLTVSSTDLEMMLKSGKKLHKRAVNFTIVGIISGILGLVALPPACLGSGGLRGLYWAKKLSKEELNKEELCEKDSIRGRLRRDLVLPPLNKTQLKNLVESFQRHQPGKDDFIRMRDDSKLT